MSHLRHFSLGTSVAAAITIMATASAQEFKTPAPIGLMSKVYFEDGFEGKALKGHWEVSNPDTENYIVEDGVLLLIAKAVGGLDNADLPNLFRLNKDLPAGDWTATVIFSAEFQTSRDWLQFGLYGGPDKYLITSFFAYYGCCYESSLTVRTKKKSGEDVTEFENQAWYSGGDFRPFTETIPQPITLKLIKEGRIYRSAVHFEGQKNDAGESIWIETDRLLLLRAPEQFVLAVSQWEEVKGESLFSINSVTIETQDK